MKATLKVFGVLFVIFILTLLGFIVFPNDFHKPNECLSSSDSTFSVMTFNIDATKQQKNSPQKLKLFRELLEKEKPSILCLQELSLNNKEIIEMLDSIYGICDSLSYADKKWRFLFYSRYPIRNFQRYKCYSELDTTNFDSKLLTEYKIISKQIPIMSAEFEVFKGKWITLYSGHLRSSAYSNARRSMGENTPWVKGIPLYWKNYKFGKQIRDFEAENIRRYIDKNLLESKPVIIAGDLNDWNNSDCLNNLIENNNESYSLKDSWKEGGKGWGFTYFGWNLRLTLDHILYSKDFKLIDVKVVDCDISDHRPLISLFQLHHNQ